MGMNTVIHGKDSSGNPEHIGATNEALHVTDGVSGAAHNRLIPAAALTHPGDDTNNCATWTVAEGVTKLTIMATYFDGEGPTAAGQVVDYIFVTLDALDGSNAATLLSVSSFDIDTDVSVFKIPFNVRTTLPISSTAIRRCDVLPVSPAVGTTGAHILIEAI